MLGGKRGDTYGGLIVLQLIACLSVWFVFWPCSIPFAPFLYTLPTCAAAKELVLHCLEMGYLGIF